MSMRQWTKIQELLRAELTGVLTNTKLEISRMKPPDIKITTPSGVVIFMEAWGFNMLGRNEFALRRGFAYGKTLVRRKSAAPLCGAPVPARHL